MNQERAERNLELKVGAFAIAVVLIGVAVVLILGNQRHVFESRATLYAAFPDVSGLREGAPVWLSGVNVGTVTRVVVGPPGQKQVRLSLEVTRTMLDRIRQDSVASIGSQGLLGDKIVTISLGSTASPPAHDGEELRSETPADFNTLVDQANVILERAKEVADNAASVTKSLADPKTIAAFRGSLHSVHSLLTQVEQGPGLAHSLFYDKKTANELQRLTTQLNQIAGHVDQGVSRIDRILDATDADGKQIVNNLSRAARQVGDTAEAVQKSKIIAHLDKASGDLADITGFVRSGRGTVGSLITDPTVYEQLVTVLGGVQRSRILRALVRYAIAKDDGRAAAKMINTPVEAKTPPPVPKPSRAKR